MGCRDNKLKYTCGDQKQNSRCTFYEGYLPPFSELEDCVTIEETTEEIYKHIEDLEEATDLKGLGKLCLDYSEFQEGDNLKVNEALLTHEKEICELKSKKETKGLDISTLDLGCLTDPCNNTITTEQQLIQALINEVCILKNT